MHLQKPAGSYCSAGFFENETTRFSIVFFEFPDFTDGFAADILLKEGNGVAAYMLTAVS